MNISAADVLVSALLICSMTALGLELTVDGLRRALVRPAALVWGLLANVVLLPLVAWGLGLAVGASPALLAALILCAACPGGGTGALLVRLSKSDAPFGAALMLMLCLVSTVTSPWTAALLVPGSVDRLTLALNMLNTLLIFQFLPMLLAATLRHVRPALAISLQPHVSRLGLVLLLVLVVVLMWREHAVVLAHGWIGIGSTLAVVTSSAGFALAVPRSATGAMAMVSVVRNLSAALMLSAVCLRDPSVTTGVLVYGMMMYLVALGLITPLRRLAP